MEQSMNVYKQQDNFLKLTLKNIIWTILGILLGIITNNIIKHFITKYKIVNNKVKILLHIIACGIMLSFVQIYASNYFGWSWQNITPGLFFISFYFGVQYNIFGLLQNEFAL